MGANDASLGVSIEAKLDRLSGQLSKSNQLIGGWARQTSQRLDAMKGQYDQLGRSAGRSLQGAERQITASSDRIRRQLLLVSTALGGTFAADRVRAFADGYTRFTNQLKIADLSGAKLATTQEQLFLIAQKYGVELEGLGTLYSKVAQAGDSLSATQGQLIKFSNGVGAALKIQGGSAASTQGAIQQLGQLLGTGTVRAEEFNSVNEGARPILQAVARGIDKYKGSVAALRNDVIAGKVTSQAFFDGFLRGSGELETKAVKANLTIGASFTVLNNALGKYIGETDANLSATERFAVGMKGLADNIDLVVPALAVIATGLAARSFGPMIQGATEAAVAAGRLRIAHELGNATLLGSAAAIRQKAALTAQLAAAEAAQAAARVTELRAESAALRENIALATAQVAAQNAARTQAAANAAAGFGALSVGAGRASKAPNAGAAEAERARLQTALVVNAKRLTTAETELAAATTAEAVAAGRATVAQTAHGAAIGATGLAARAGAASMSVLSGTMAFFGGPVGLAIIALTAAVFGTSAALRQAREDAAAADKVILDLKAALELAARYGGSAAGKIKQVGTEAQAGVAPMKAFAGAVGDVAAKLRELAQERRLAAIAGLEATRAAAKVEATKFDKKDARDRAFASVGFTGGEAPLPASVKADVEKSLAADPRTKQAAEIDNLIATTEAEIARLKKAPLTAFVNDTDRAGGRNIGREISDLQAQLKAAQAAHNGAAVREIQEQIYVRKQTTKYMKEGLSYEVANSLASKEASAIKSAGDSYAAGRDGKRDARSAAAAERKAEADRLAAVRADKAFNGDLRRAQLDYLEAQVGTADSAEARLALELQRLAFARDQRDKEIGAEGPTTSGGTGKYTAEEVKQLKALNDQTANQEAVNLVIRDTRRVVAEDLSLRLAAMDDQAELLGLQAALATTAKGRRDAELRLLALQEREERARLEAITVLNGATAAEAAEAKARLASLPELYRVRQQGVIEDTRGPVESFIAANTAMDQLAETAEGRLVGALNSAFDAAGQAAVGVGDFGDAMTNIIRQLLAEALAQQFKTAAVSFLATLPIPGFANGTPSAPGGLAYVHRDELVNLPKGSQVIPSHALHAAANLRPQRVARSVNQFNDYRITGAVMTSELMEQMRAISARDKQRAVTQAVGEAVSLSRRGAPGRMADYEMLGT